MHDPKPGYILCGEPNDRKRPDKGVGATCRRLRPIQDQCLKHPRPDEEIEQIAREYCAETGFPLPEIFEQRVEEDQREHQYQLWFVQFKLLGCNVRAGTEAARIIGIPDDSAKNFAYHARKWFKDEISAWYEEQAMGAEEVVALKAKTARNIPAKYLVAVEPDNPANRSVIHDVRAMVEAGDGDQIIGIKRDAHGNLIYEFADPQKAQDSIIDIHGLKKVDKDLTRWTDAELAQKYDKIRQKLNPNGSPDG